MKKLFLQLVMVLALGGTMYAQTQTFDIATFVPPRGWSESQTNGVLTLQTQRSSQGRTEFCQLYLFPSQATNADAVANFHSEWDAKVARQLGLSGHPSPQPETSPDGWTSVTDHVDVINQGTPLRVILFTATGFGRLVSVVVSVSPNAYQQELEAFFQNLDLHAPAGGQNVPAGRQTVPGAPESPGVTSGPAAAGSLANYVYEIPDGWRRQDAADHILLSSPMYNNGETCQLMLLPTHNSSASLGDEAVNIFRRVFQTDPLSTYPSPPPTMEQGMSPQGWEYFTIHKLVGGQEGDARTRGTIVLLARVNGQIATIIGTSKDFMVSNCFGLLRGDEFPKFFYSLQFKNAQPSAQSHAALQKRLAGTWMMATGSAGLAFTFNASGRYSDTAATQYRSRISDTQVLQTTQGFFGNGSYTFDGNTLVMTNDNQKRSVYYFRLQQVSKDSGRSWQDQLVMLSPGASGEVTYRRE